MNVTMVTTFPTLQSRGKYIFAKFPHICTILFRSLFGLDSCKKNVCLFLSNCAYKKALRYTFSFSFDYHLLLIKKSQFIILIKYPNTKYQLIHIVVSNTSILLCSIKIYCKIDLFMYVGNSPHNLSVEKKRLTDVNISYLL
jgi:hypothetical protein